MKGGSLVRVGVAADQNLMMAPPHEDIEVLKRSRVLNDYALRQRDIGLVVAIEGSFMSADLMS